MNHISIIGGGIVGLSSAYYLHEAGYQVTIFDKGDLSDNCSFGNAGYVCPSHFVPLAAPGIVWQGFKWMFNPLSPFYVKPSLSKALVTWGLKFMQSANAQHVEDSAIPLRDISLLSQKLFEDWEAQDIFAFGYERKGMLEVFQTHAVAEHAHHTLDKAQALGLDVNYLDKDQLQALEPQTPINALGALQFNCDTHVYPNKLMKALIADLQNKGVVFRTKETIVGFEKKQGKVTHVRTQQQQYATDGVVIAAGSWSRELAEQLALNLPLMAGRGYSLTLENSPFHINHPIILAEGRVALTPMDGNKIRMGGTMEVVSTDTPPNFQRVKGILKSVKSFLPTFDIPFPAEKDIWHGFRPCSADGLPYIGRTKAFNNVVVATGHSMMGLSLGPASGKLVEEIISEKATSIDIQAFSPERFYS
ncbi:NAD(P)/FAD-dependent oxidoreductase [Arcicella rigui]|uniref:FAD-dependent oxidoreductase n=1 Tax=Arcicella rigui TaxID=797020 RepID=A0ABU5Q623_9BACT|nr:FAD-dependent oxidoreductase [Arcicella rigui]MEA5138296.1 FAD-dependent oxidoreductase [Arcicella rigui]